MSTTGIPSEIHYPIIYYGSVTFAGVVGLPTGILEAGHWNDTGDPLAASNVEHQFPVAHVQKNGADVVAATEYLYRARKAVTLLDAIAAVATPPTGDYTVSIDIQKYSGGSWSSVLNGAVAVEISSTATADAVVALTLSGTAGVAELAANELLRVVVTVAGSSGTQAQGLITQVNVREQPR